MGTPCEAYKEAGAKVWHYEQSTYGGTEVITGDINFIPFRYQGQYEDAETGLYYNRFRYYSPEEECYISQDPIGLEGGMELYNYVHDTNAWIDMFGLSVGEGQVGSYGDLKKVSDVGDNLDLHHIPQDKLGHLPKADGGAIVLTHDEHRQTRTYKSKGKGTAIADANRPFKDVLIDDLKDIRKIAGKKYDKSIKNIIKFYEKKGFLKKGKVTMKNIKGH